MNQRRIKHRIGVTLGTIGGAVILKLCGPGVDGRTRLLNGNGIGQLQGRRRGICPNPNFNREIATNGSWLQLYLDDFGITIDVVIGIEGGVETKPRSQGQNDIGLADQS